MNDLDRYRQEIDALDKQLSELFEKRMAVVKKVALYKKEQGLEILNEQRELAVLEKNINFIENEELKAYYKEVLSVLMKVSKDYQKRLM